MQSCPAWVAFAALPPSIATPAAIVWLFWCCSSAECSWNASPHCKQRWGIASSGCSAGTELQVELCLHPPFSSGAWLQNCSAWAAFAALLALLPSIAWLFWCCSSAECSRNASPHCRQRWGIASSGCSAGTELQAELCLHPPFSSGVWLQNCSAWVAFAALPSIATPAVIAWLFWCCSSAGRSRNAAPHCKQRWGIASSGCSAGAALQAELCLH